MENSSQTESAFAQLAIAPDFIFERRYRLAARLELTVSEIEGKSVGLIFCRYPLYVSRTTPQIVALLQKCDGQRSVAAIAREVGKKPATLLPTLEALRQKRLLELEAVTPGLEVTNRGTVGFNSQASATSAFSGYPTVSFIVPVRNRPALLARCLQSILELDYPPEKYEIIVVDDASTDATAEVAASFGVKLVRNSCQLQSGRSRNRALPLANHALLALIDSDVVVAADWLKQLVPGFDDPALVAVGGAVRSDNLASAIGRYEDVKSSLFKGNWPVEVSLNGELDQLSTANLLVRRSAFEAIGGHDETLIYGEDVDLCWRLLKAGGRVRYQPAAEVRHAYRRTLPAFLKTRFGYATGEAPLQARHADKRRVLAIPFWPGLAWLSLFGWLTGPRSRWLMALTGSGPLLWKVGQKWRSLQPYKLSLTPLDVLKAEGRSFLAAGYHLGQHLNRYYSLPFLILALARPKIMALPVAATLLGSAYDDYRRRQPHLNFLTYAALYLLENAAYQPGLIKGCWQTGNWKALIPKIKLNFGS